MILNENLFEDVELTLDDKLKYIKEYPTYTSDRRTYFTRPCKYYDLDLTPEQGDTFFKFLEQGELDNFWTENAELSDKIYQAGRMGGHLILDDEDVMPGDWEDFETFNDVLEAERDEYRVYSDDELEDWEEEEAKEEAERKVNETYEKLKDFDNRVDQLIDLLKQTLDGYVDLDELNGNDFQESYKVVDKDGKKVAQGGGFETKKEAEMFAAQYGEKDLKVVKESFNDEKIVRERTEEELKEYIEHLSKAIKEYTDKGDLEEAEWYQKQLDWAKEQLAKKEIESEENVQESLDKNSSKWFYVTIKRGPISKEEKEKTYSLLIKAEDENKAKEIIKTGMFVLTDVTNYDILDCHEATQEELDSDTVRINLTLNESASLNESELSLLNKPSIEDVQKIVDSYINKFGRVGAGLLDDLDAAGYYLDENDKVQLKVKPKNETLKEELDEETQVECGLTTMINSLIKDELEAIDAYNSAIVTLEVENKSEFTNVVRDIISEENKHIGQLQAILKELNPQTTADIDEGQQEGQEQIDQVNNEAENNKEETKTTIDTEEGTIKTFKLDKVEDIKES